MNWLYGCGEMYTTVEDMKKLDEAIMDGKLLSKQSVSDMFLHHLQENMDLVSIFTQIIIITTVY